MTALFLKNTQNNGIGGTYDIGLDARGDGMNTVQVNTATGTQDILMRTWMSEPLAAGSISAATVTFNIWGYESNMNANAGLRVRVVQCSNAGAEVAAIVESNQGSELGFSGAAARNWTATATARTITAGQRIKIEVRAVNVGTMASGYTVNADYDHNIADADGDSFVSFTDTIAPSSQTIEESVSLAREDSVALVSNIVAENPLALAAEKSVSVVAQQELGDAVGLSAEKSVAVVGNIIVEERLYDPA